MKTFCLAIICILLFAGTAAAQEEPVWTPLYSETFADNSFGWPVGTASEGALTVDRQLRDGSYIWNVNASDAGVSWLGFIPDYPLSAQRFRFSTEVDLPDFEPYACAGLLFDGGEASFNAYVVCNDKTYSVLRFENGALTNAIPYSPIHDFDSFSAQDLAVEISNGWANLYLNDAVLDTVNVGGFGYGRAGLIVMPQSTDPTEIRFSSLAMEGCETGETSSDEDMTMDEGISQNMARLIKMLNMKDRMDSFNGSYAVLPVKELSLASMGYSKTEYLPLSGQDVILQADIDFSSAYEHPDYANSGCGFVFRDQGNGTFMEVFAAMDGGVYLNAYRFGQKIPVMTYTWGSWAVKGSGKLAVAADAQHITVLWNDSILGTITDATWIADGAAGYLVHSGTNADYGIRCSFSNAESYVIR